MISIWAKTFGFRQANLLINKNACFFRNNAEQDNQYSSRERRDGSGYKKLFRTEHVNKRFDKTNRNTQQNQTNVEQFVKTINQINKQFLGIKLNTDYFKVYIEKKFEEVCKADKSQYFKVNDLPFTVKSKSTQSENQNNEPTTSFLKNTAAVKMLNKLISQQRLTKQLQRLAKTYFTDLVTGQRNSRMQANFEVYARKVVQTLKLSKWSFKITNTEQSPKVTLKKVTLLKGVKVNRNDNYTVDSYKLNSDQQQEGVLTYTLWKKKREEYPQSEWFAQKFIVARIQAQVTNTPTVHVLQQSSIQNSTKGITHSFVFQADLTVPPTLSVLSLSPQEFINSYRLKPQSIYITNVDNKNVWFNMAYKEDQKKFKLINKLI